MRGDTISSTIYVKNRDLKLLGDSGAQYFEHEAITDLSRKIAKAALIRVEKMGGEDGETAICAYIATSPMPVLQPVQSTGNPGFVPLEVTRNASEIFDDVTKTETELRRAQQENAYLRGKIAEAEQLLGQQLLRPCR